MMRQLRETIPRLSFGPYNSAVLKTLICFGLLLREDIVANVKVFKQLKRKSFLSNDT